MNEIKIEQFGIEITRKCNMQCDFCMRGKSQNVEISDEMINEIFDSLSRYKKVGIGVIKKNETQNFE